MVQQAEKKDGAERSSPLTVAFSTVCLPDLEAQRIFIEDYRRLEGGEPAWELGYNLGQRFLESAAFLQGRVLSAHAPCPRTEHFPNLGSSDPAVNRESLETVVASARTSAAFGGGQMVLHPGYTLEAAVPVDHRRRIALLATMAGPEERYIWRKEGRICTPGYCDTPLYRRHRDQAIFNLREAAGRCAVEGVLLTVENMNPRITYLFQLPSEFLHLAREAPELRFCLDLGHLWMSAQVHGFDFLEGLEQILATGKVASTHLHDNASSRAGAGGGRYTDDHMSLGDGVIPLRESLSRLQKAGVSLLVIESLAAPLENLKRLRSLLENPLPCD